MGTIFKNGLRSLWALALAGLSGVVLWVAYVALSAALDGSPDASVLDRIASEIGRLGSFLFFVAVICMYFYGIIAVVIAMPLQAIMQALGLKGFVPSVLLACVLGACFWHIGAEDMSTYDMDEEDMEVYRAENPERLHWDWLGTGAALGLYFGTVTWLVRRPDKDAERAREVPAPFRVTALDGDRK